MSIDTTPRADGDSAPPQTPRQIASAINGIALSIQCRASCCQSLIDAIIESIDGMKPDAASGHEYRRVVNLVEVLKDYLTPVSGHAEQVEIMSMRLHAESAA